MMNLFENKEVNRAFNQFRETAPNSHHELDYARFAKLVILLHIHNEELTYDKLNVSNNEWDIIEPDNVDMYMQIYLHSKNILSEYDKELNPTT